MPAGCWPERASGYGSHSGDRRPARRDEVVKIGGRSIGWRTADTLATDDRGWAFNLAVFRVVSLLGAALHVAWSVVRWTERILPALPPSAWQPVSFYALLPLDFLSNAELARDLNAVAGEHTVRGYDAYVAIASRLPVLWPMALAMRLPFVARRGRRLYRRVADRRARAVVADVPARGSSARELRWISVVGIALVVGQTVVSGSQLVSSAVNVPQLARLSQLGRRFDYSPLFTGTRREHREVWKPRAVLADGREILFAPATFNQAFGSPA